MLEEIEAAMKLAGLHSLQGANASMPPEVTSFDVQAVKDIATTDYPILADVALKKAATANGRRLCGSKF